MVGPCSKVNGEINADPCENGDRGPPRPGNSALCKTLLPSVVDSRSARGTALCNCATTRIGVIHDVL